jgi:hypothetical protein
MGPFGGQVYLFGSILLVSGVAPKQQNRVSRALIMEQQSIALSAFLVEAADHHRHRHPINSVLNMGVGV